MTSRYPTGHPGGVEGVVRNLLKEMGDGTACGHIVHITAFKRRGRWERTPLIGDAVAAVRFAVATRHADLVIINGAEYAWATLLLARARRRPVAVVWHGTRADESLRPARHLPDRLALALFHAASARTQGFALRAQATIAAGPLVEAHIRRRYGYTGKIAAIPNGVDIARYTQAEGTTSEDPGVRPVPAVGRAIRLVWSGMSPYQKGLGPALDCCAELRRRGHAIELTIIGLDRGQAPGEYAACSWITWLGPIEPSAVTGVLAAQDLFVATSRSEACSLAALEALAAGLVVVGGPPVEWTIADGGITVEDLEAVTFADAIESVIEDDTWDVWRVRARARAGEFTWERAAAAYCAALAPLTAAH